MRMHASAAVTMDLMGFVYFDAKSKLIDYYRFKLGAVQVGS